MITAVQNKLDEQLYKYSANNYSKVDEDHFLEGCEITNLKTLPQIISPVIRIKLTQFKHTYLVENISYFIFTYL